MVDHTPVIPSLPKMIWICRVGATGSLRGARVGVVAMTMLMVSACASQAPLPLVELAPRTTYSWDANIQLPPRLGTRERLRRIDRILRDSIDAELARRGYQQIASGSTDMVVLYYVFLEDKDPRSLQDYAQYRSRGGQGSATQVLGGYTEGTLIVEILDGYTLQPIWESSATAIPDPNGQGEGLPSIIAEIMAPLARR